MPGTSLAPAWHQPGLSGSLEIFDNIFGNIFGNARQKKSPIELKYHTGTPPKNDLIAGFVMCIIFYIMINSMKVPVCFKPLPPPSISDMVNLI